MSIYHCENCGRPDSAITSLGGECPCEFEPGGAYSNEKPGVQPYVEPTEVWSGGLAHDYPSSSDPEGPDVDVVW